jgi:hypothetical protein
MFKTIISANILERHQTLGELWSVSCGAGAVERERSELRNAPCGTGAAERESKTAGASLDPNFFLIHSFMFYLHSPPFTTHLEIRKLLFILIPHKLENLLFTLIPHLKGQK